MILSRVINPQGVADGWSVVWTGSGEQDIPAVFHATARPFLGSHVMYICVCFVQFFARDTNTSVRDTAAVSSRNWILRYLK